MNIFIRYASKNNNLPNNFLTRTYDDRMLYILSGQGKMIFDDVQYDICENTLCYYPSGECYMPSSSKNNPLTFVTINFDFERDYEYINKTLRPVAVSDFDETKILYKDKSERPSLFQKRFVMKNLSLYRKDFCEIADFFTAPTLYGREVASSLLMAVCYKLLDTKAAPQNENYMRVLEYINENYAAIESNKEIADFLGYHEYYLNRVFKKCSGKTIHSYINEVRVKEGAKLITNTKMPFSEIAYKVGFKNPNHFSENFKKYFSVYPRDFRKSYYGIDWQNENV